MNLFLEKYFYRHYCTAILGSWRTIYEKVYHFSKCVVMKMVNAIQQKMSETELSIQ